MKPATPGKKYGGGGMRRGDGSAFKRDFLQKSTGSSMISRSLGISLGADPDAPSMDILMEAASVVEKQVHQDFFKQFPDDFDDEDLA